MCPDDQEVRQASRHPCVSLVELRSRVGADEVGVHCQVTQAEEVEHLRGRGKDVTGKRVAGGVLDCGQASEQCLKGCRPRGEGGKEKSLRGAAEWEARRGVRRRWRLAAGERVLPSSIRWVTYPRPTHTHTLPVALHNTARFHHPVILLVPPHPPLLTPASQRGAGSFPRSTTLPLAIRLAWLSPNVYASKKAL